MINLINGISQEKYEKPKVTDILAWMLTTNKQKEGLEVLKHQSCEEVEARVTKAKADWKASLLVLSIMGHKEFIDPFHIEVHITTSAYDASIFIDLGARCNVLSYDAWVELGQAQLTSLKMDFKKLSYVKTPSLGKCYLGF